MRKKNANLPALDSAKATVESKTTLASAEPGRNGPVLSEDAIRLRAYLKREATGMPSGDGVPFWLEAQRELGNGKRAMLPSALDLLALIPPDR